MLAALMTLALVASPPPFDRDFALSIRGERVGALHVSFDGALFRYDALTVVRRGSALSDASFSTAVKLDDAHLPSTLALWLFRDGEQRCLAVQDERDGKPGQVCATRTGRSLVGTLLGEPFTALLDGDGGPDLVELAGQKTRFERTDGPLPLPQPRDLFGGSSEARELGALEDAIAAHVSGASKGCEVKLALDRASPVHDESLGKPVDDAWARTAADLRLGTRARWAASLALAKFVDQAIASVPASVADEDASGVWRSRRGSCVGQARVFSALAGGLGVPVRLVFGALVEDGKLAAHAWNEVEIGGRWYGVDASRGMAPVGPEHLPLAREGDADPLRAGRCLLALPEMRWTVEAK